MSRRRPSGFVLLLVAVSAALLAVIVAPFAASFFAAAVLAGVLHPTKEAVAERLGGRSATAAFVVTVGVTLVAVGPLAGLCVFVAKQATALYVREVEGFRTGGVEGLVDGLPDALQAPAHWIVEHWPGGFRVLGEEAGAELGISGVQIEAATSVVAAILDGLATVLVDLSVLVLTLYFLLEQGKALVAWVVDVMPLDRAEAERLVAEFRDVTRAVFGATVLTALIQTAISWVGYAIADISYQPIALLLTLVCAVIPVIGAAAVVITIGGLLWLEGATGMGVFLVVWGLLPVGLSDNLLKPWLAQGKIRLPGPVVLFAMLGGAVVFGAFGIVAGPLIVAFFLASLRLLSRRDAASA